MFRPRTIILTVAIILLSAQLNPARGEKTDSDSKKTIKALSEAFNQKPRPVRSSHAMMPTTYIEKEGNIFYYVVPRRLKRLSEIGELFTLKKFRFETAYVGMEFNSQSGAKLHVRVYSEQEMTQYFYNTVVPGVVRDLFDFQEPWSFQGVIGNSQSKMVHMAGASHLPVQELRVEFESVLEAESAGYKSCIICFDTANWIPVDGYMTSRKIAQEAARTLEIIYPPVEDEKVQSEIKDLGEKIVANFPITTMGFSYEFRVLHSELPWAQSFSTGFVYVSDRLLEMIEDPRELEFILAHEIAHVELYFTRISFSPTKAQMETLPSYVFNSYYQMLRTQELETDFIALVYMAEVHGNSSVLNFAVTALRKVQSYGEAIPARVSRTFDSHPAILERILNLKTNFFLPLTSGPRFCNLKDDETVLVAEIMGVSLYDGRVRLFVRISANDLMNKKGNVPGSGDVFGEDGKKYTFNRVDYPQYIGRNRSRIFTYVLKGPSRFLNVDEIVDNLGIISGLDLGNIGGASDWEICTD